MQSSYSLRFLEQRGQFLRLLLVVGDLLARYGYTLGLLGEHAPAPLAPVEIEAGVAAWFTQSQHAVHKAGRRAFGRFRTAWGRWKQINVVDMVESSFVPKYLLRLLVLRRASAMVNITFLVRYQKNSMEIIWYKA